MVPPVEHLPARADGAAAERAAAAARFAGEHDRNAEAVVLYQQAIELDPSRRKEWLWKLAEQMTWAHREKEAIPLFREALTAPSSSGSSLIGRDEEGTRSSAHRCSSAPNASFDRGLSPTAFTAVTS